MPGRRGANLRSGDLAEAFGLLLLKGIAAVADVPRTEDVGLDAVATLLRPAQDGSCYAEDSFVVQLKSDSKSSMKYRPHELTCFLAQSQPMFIGLVSRKDARISLYSTLYANQAVLVLHATRITMHFSESEYPFPWAGGQAASADVWLGPPVLSWTFAELLEEGWPSRAYGVLKRFLGIARREHGLLSLGQCSELVWSTNDEDSIKSSHRMTKAHPSEFCATADQCMPCLRALLFHAIHMSGEQGSLLAVSLLGVVGGLRDLGVTIDASTDDLAKVFVALRGRKNA
jgi:hypothetical protein